MTEVKDMAEYASIQEYNADLRRELDGLDEDIRTGALFDSEEHLGLMVQDFLGRGIGTSWRNAFKEAVEVYGYPFEIAEAYRKVMEN